MRFGEIYTTNTYLYFASNTWVPFFARYWVTNDSRKAKRFSPYARKMLLNLLAKVKILHTIIYHYMTSYGYVIMIRVDSCIIWFRFDCIMQLYIEYEVDTIVTCWWTYYYHWRSPITHRGRVTFTYVTTKVNYALLVNWTLRNKLQWSSMKSKYGYFLSIQCIWDCRIQMEDIRFGVSMF